jgi:hypothetical protein
VAHVIGLHSPLKNYISANLKAEAELQLYDDVQTTTTRPPRIAPALVEFMLKSMVTVHCSINPRSAVLASGRHVRLDRDSHKV